MTAKLALQLILDRGLDAWVYTQTQWLIHKADAPHAAREAWTVKFEAEIVPAFTAAHLADAMKIVGVSDDARLDLLRKWQLAGPYWRLGRLAGRRGYLADCASSAAQEPL